MKKTVVAVDFGASNGKVFLGKYDRGSVKIKEVYSFPNQPVIENGTFYWDFKALYDEMMRGIKLAQEEESIDSVAINTWGVDYGLIDNKGELKSKPVHYRDSRGEIALKALLEKKDAFTLFKLSGLQSSSINTLTQLIADQTNRNLENVEDFLLMPNLFNYYLTGKKQAEISIASTSQLLDIKTNDWNYELIDALNLPKTIFPKIVNSGTFVGYIKDPQIESDIKVINVCTHDTASAVAGIPSQSPMLFISSGTWSIVGTELKKPILTQQAFDMGLSNEIGIDRSTRLLKNMTGLWILQEIKKELELDNHNFSYEELEEKARKVEKIDCVIDPGEEVFATKGGMIKKVQDFALETGQVVPSTVAELAHTVYQSLACAYKETILELEEISNHCFDEVHIVGGGSKSSFLCQYLSDLTQKKVISGPHEATSIGNIFMQFRYHGLLDSSEEMRNLIYKTQDIVVYHPNKKSYEEREKVFEKYMKIRKERGN